MAILNRNVVFRCGAGCILTLGVCVRVARWSFWIGMWCFVVARAAFLKVGVRVRVVRWPFWIVARCLVVAGAPLPKAGVACILKDMML